MKEEVIIQSICITKKKEQTFFQVKLPRDTYKIIGIETGLYILAAPPNLFVPLQDNSGFIRRNNMMGILQLQTNGKANIFYSKEIFERDINIGTGEIKIITDQPNQEENVAFLRVEPPDGNSFDFFTCWTHGSKREEDPLNICGCTLINGQFKDAVGEYFGTDISYKVILYIWIERKTNEQQ